MKSNSSPFSANFIILPSFPTESLRLAYETLLQHGLETRLSSWEYSYKLILDNSKPNIHHTLLIKNKHAVTQQQDWELLARDLRIDGVPSYNGLGLKV